MNASFYNGVLGVKAHQFGLDVWANNIANINTIGFKSYTPEFASIFATTLQEAYFDTSLMMNWISSLIAFFAFNQSPKSFSQKLITLERSLSRLRYTSSAPCFKM